MPWRERSDCPVACTLDVLGDRWSLLVIRDLLLGKTRFDQFRASPEGIASNILAERLRRLEAAGLVERFPSETHSARGTYALTPAGRGLRGVLLAMRDWGLEHVPGTRALPGAEPRGRRSDAARSRSRGRVR